MSYNFIQILFKAMHKVFEQIQRFDYGICLKPGHEKSPLNLVCADIGCSDCSAICIHCQQQQHEEHDTLPLKSYLKKLYIASLSNLQQQSLISWTSKIDETKKQTVEYLTDLKQKFNQSIDQIITLIQMQYMNISVYLKDLTNMKSNTVKLIRMYNELNPTILSNFNIAELSSLKINKTDTENSKSNNKQDQIIRREIIKIKSLNLKLKSLLKYAPVEEQTDVPTENQNEKIYKVYSLQNQVKILEEGFRGRCKQVQKILQKSHIQSQTISLPKIKQIFEDKIKTIMALKKNKFSWSDVYKGAVFFQNGNIMQRNGATGPQRFALFNQSLVQYVQKKQKAVWCLKIFKLVGWIGIGICIKQKIVSNGYKFSYETLGHGSYLISSNGYTWSSSVQAFNSAYHGFNFTTGDFVFVQFEPAARKLNFFVCKENVLLQKTKNKLAKNLGISFSFSPKYLTNKTGISDLISPLSVQLSSLTKTFTLDIEQNMDFQPCVNLCSIGDAVEIVD